jgi:hypothetical protein
MRPRGTGHGSKIFRLAEKCVDFGDRMAFHPLRAQSSRLMRRSTI